MYPLKFNPVYKEVIWGGINLQRQLGRRIPSDHTGESWEVADHPAGVSPVANGVLRGKSISELTQIWGNNLWGHRVSQSEMAKFPLMVKLLDVGADLSIQVHPDNQYALHKENQLGKHEVWYVLRAQPCATVYCGLKPGVTKEVFQEALGREAVVDLLNEFPVREGDLIDIPPGTIHALRSGLLIVEIQQSSDLSYRVFDYNRLDRKGQKRELHIEKALEVINFTPGVEEKDFLRTRLQSKAAIVRNQFFEVELTRNPEKKTYYQDGSRFYLLTNVAGRGVICYNQEEYQWDLGETVLIPAQVTEFTIQGEVSYLKTFLP